MTSNDEVYWYQQSGRDFLRIAANDSIHSPRRIWIDDGRGRVTEIGEFDGISPSDFRFVAPASGGFTVRLDSDPSAKAGLSRTFQKSEPVGVEFENGRVLIPTIVGRSVDVDIFRWEHSRLKLDHRIIAASEIKLDQLICESLPWLTSFPHYLVATPCDGNGRTGISEFHQIRPKTPIVDVIFQSIGDDRGGYAFIQVNTTNCPEIPKVSIRVLLAEGSNATCPDIPLNLGPDGKGHWNVKEVMHGNVLQAQVSEKWVRLRFWALPPRRAGEPNSKPIGWIRIPDNRWIYTQFV